MTWAWATPLPPTPKLVLMALADIADDQGICWPSHRTLALKCSLADRTVRRMLILLQAQQLLLVESRVRKDGSRASNCYRLAIDAHPPDNLSGEVDTRVQGRGSQVTRGVDTVVLPRTTNEPSIESPLPLPERDRQCDPVRTYADGGGGDCFFPKGLNPSWRHALRQHLAALTPAAAQQVLDELAGRMAVTRVKNPVRYCAVLIERMRRGEFVPELGLGVADARQADIARQAERARAEQVSADGLKFDAVKLPKKLREALERARAKSNDPPLDAEATQQSKLKKSGARDVEAA
jgi:hypothetical protein